MTEASEVIRRRFRPLASARGHLIRALVGLLLLATGCPDRKPSRPYRVETKRSGKREPARPRHSSHPHPHGAHPHGRDGHHHHPHPHPHLDGEDGHHHPH